MTLSFPNAFSINGSSGGSGDGLTPEIKDALLQIAEKVAYIDDGGATYYNDLFEALYTVTSIEAVFTQGSATIYDNDSLDSLKQYLTVTATYKGGTTAVITNYTLSGTLTVGTSTITVTYGNVTDTFDVTVTDKVVYNWDYTMGLPEGFTILNPNNGSISLASDGVKIKCTSSSSNISYKFLESIIRDRTEFDYIYEFKPVTLSDGVWAGIAIELYTGSATGIGWLHFKPSGTYYNDTKIASYVMTTNAVHTVRISNNQLYVDDYSIVTIPNNTRVATEAFVSAAMITEFYFRSLQIVHK